MERASNRNGLRRIAAQLWDASPVLTAGSLLMLVALAAALVGLIVDPRIITGAPAWLKPAKFAVSTAIYMLTLAWMFTWLPEWRRTRGVIGWLTAVVFVLEVAIIGLQAWRGATSHFNIGNVFDAVLFAVMGVAIVVQTLASVAVAIALCRQTFEDRPLGWAMRFGMIIVIIGASTGALMTRPTAAQLEQARVSGRIAVAGAHTVGAPDGGPGLVGTGWSTTNGDIRVPHFLGIHAMQALPLLAILLRRRRTIEAVRLTVIGAGSYASLFAILLWQALRGQPLVYPDGITLAVLIAWAILTALAVRFALARRPLIGSHAVALS